MCAFVDRPIVMNSSRKDSQEMSAQKASNYPQAARRSSTASTTNGTTLARFISDDQTEYLMRQTRVTVGRSSARSAADVDMGDSSFISRNHLEIYLDHNKFFVLVTGKNGIFVDDMFHRKGSPPVELPQMYVYGICMENIDTLWLVITLGTSAV